MHNSIQSQSVAIAQRSDAALLALCLRHRESTHTAETIAQQLLDRFGSLYGVFGATDTQVQQIKGKGPGRVAKIRAMQEVQQRIVSQPIYNSPELNSSEAVEVFLQSRLQYAQNECFAVLFLDSQHHFLHYQQVFQGTIDRSPVYPRVIVQLAMEHNAAGVILAHNHPSGNVEPSEADLHITQILKDALGLVDVKILDHFVIGAGQAVSFRARGLIT